jgi:hypothetical protein
MKNLLIVALAGIAAIASAIAFNEYLEISRLQRVISADTALHSVVRRISPLALSRAKEKQSEPTIAPTVLPAKANSVAQAGLTVVAPQPTPGVERLAKILDNPEAFRHDAALLAAQMRRRYGMLLKQLGLSAEDCDRFIALQTDRSLVEVDVAIAQIKAGDPTSAELDVRTRTVVVENAAIDQQIANLLGPNGYSQYQAYNQTAGESEVVSQAQQMLSYSAVGLTDEQVNRLCAAMAAENVDHLNERVLVDVQSAVTPEQFETLKQLWQEQELSHDQDVVQSQAVQNLVVKEALLHKP